MVGVRVTVVPCGNDAVQVPSKQDNPEGLLVTLPLPSPVKETLNEREPVELEAKFALTEAEEVDRATTQEPVPVHAPPQPENVLPLLGVAVRVTFDPCGNVPEHVPLEQDTPPGLLLTAPLPSPAKVTLKALEGGGLEAKFALTDVEAVERVTVQELVPLQPPPLQPEKIDPDAALAKRVIGLSVEKEAVQVLPQFRALGLLVIVPVPSPLLVIVKGKLEMEPPAAVN